MVAKGQGRGGGEGRRELGKGFLTWAKGKKSYSNHREFLLGGSSEVQTQIQTWGEAVTHFLGLLKWRLMWGPPLLLSFLFLPAVAADVTTRRMERKGSWWRGECKLVAAGSVGKKEILLTHTSRKFPNDQIIFFDLRFYTLLRFKNSLRIIWQLSVRLAFRILLCLPRRRNGGWSSIIKPDGPKRYIMNDS